MRHEILDVGRVGSEHSDRILFSEWSDRTKRYKISKLKLVHFFKQTFPQKYLKMKNKIKTLKEQPEKVKNSNVF